MSKTLYLMRHAKAEQVPYKSDFDRLLTDRGMMDARHQGHRAFKSSIPSIQFLRTTGSIVIFVAFMFCPFLICH